MASDKIRDLTASSIFTGIGHLKDQQKFCDLKITLKGKTFSCHRVVLASVSKFFEARLVSKGRKNSLAHVQIDHKDVSYTMFQSLLEILYKGKDLITQESVQDFLKMSLYLQIDFLTKYCEEFVRNNLQPKDCLGLWQFAQRYRLQSLAEYCFRCAAENINTLPQDELLALPKSMLFILLSLQKKLSMDDVCKTILRWVEFDQDTRSGFLTQFIPFISFSHLSGAYLADLLEYRDHPFSEHVKDSIVLVLKNSDEKYAQTRLKILCQQSVPLKSADIISVSVVIKATRLPLEHGPILEAWSDMDQRFVLAPVPKNSGCHFATCTLRNEIYLSGGTELPAFFAVYTPVENTWYVLPPLDADRGREKHAMAAVNDNIYVLGGLTKRRGNTKVLSYDVQRYEVSSQKWSLVCRLPEAVQETSAAVLGHRIYLFGGIDENGVNSDLVQCVDTVNNVAYVAGKLPACTWGTRALSNSGIIWVVLQTGQVLQMWEDFHLADEEEQQLAITKNKIANYEPMPGNKRWTVAFKNVSKISDRDHIAACMSNSEITVIGTEDYRHGCLICDVHIIDLTTGQAQGNTICLNNAESFDLQKINIPLMHLQEKAIILDVAKDARTGSDGGVWLRPYTPLGANRNKKIWLCSKLHSETHTTHQNGVYQEAFPVGLRTRIRSLHPSAPILLCLGPFLIKLDFKATSREGSDNYHQSPWYGSPYTIKNGKQTLINLIHCSGMTGFSKARTLPTTYSVTQLPQVFGDYLANNIRSFMDSILAPNSISCPVLSGSSLTEFPPVSEADIKQSQQLSC